MHRSLILAALCCAALVTGASAAAPGAGEHAVSFYYLSENDSTNLSTRPMDTKATGSTMLVGVGRGNFSEFGTLPSDNKGSGSYQQLGTAHPYTSWSTSGTALYACPSVNGGNGHVVSIGTSAWQELTMVAVEVVNGGTVQDFKWNEVLAGNPLTSQSVTTTGPAVLVAFWWGDGSQGPHAVTPNNGFVLADSVLLSGWVVQCAVAMRVVTAPGTYDVTWSESPDQGAQLWLVAVQAATPTPVPGADTGFALRQNQPNPFNPATTISYEIPAGGSGRAALRVYDLAGRVAATLLDGAVEPGLHTLRFDARDLASGTYFYRLVVEPSSPALPRFEQARPMVLLR